MSTSSQKTKDLPYIFYHEMNRKGRVPIARMARKGKVTRNTASKHLLEYYEQEILYPPQLRLKMTRQTAEYIYLLKVRDPITFSSFLISLKWVFYVCMLGGPFNIIFMSYEPVKLSHLDGFEQTILGGIRSNYVVPVIPQQSFSTAFKKILKKSEEKIEPSLFDTKLPEGKKWTVDLWDLYHYLKYNVRRKFVPLIKKFDFCTTTFYKKYQEILAQTDTYVPFFPLGRKKYTPFYLLFKTTYQDFVAHYLGELPVFSTHFRIRDSLLSYIRIPFGSDSEPLFKILSLWQHRGIIDSYEFAIPWWHDTKAPQPGIGPPSPISPNGTTLLVKGDGSEKMVNFSI